MAVLSPLAYQPAAARCRWSITLDIGEGSIGWAIGEVDDAGRLVHMVNAGVRLFESSWTRGTKEFTANGAEDRTMRGQQKRIESRARRLAAMARLFAPLLGLPAEAVKDLAAPSKGRKSDPLAVFDLRAQAAHAPLDAGDLFRVLHHIAARRGIRLAAPHMPEDDEPVPTDEDTTRAANDEKALRLEMARQMRAGGRPATCGEVMAEAIRQARIDGRQPLARARKDVDDVPGVRVPTRALVEHEFDTIRAVQQPAHPDLDWDEARRLVLDQQPIAIPPAGPCLFLGELLRKGEMFRGRTLDVASIARGLTVDPLMQELRIRETVGNFRLFVREERDDQTRWRPREAIGEQGELLEHGELTAREREILVDALIRDGDGKDTFSFPALRKLLGLGADHAFAAERDKEARGVKANPTDPLLARWVPGWFDHPLAARSAYVRDLIQRRGHSGKLKAMLAQGGHGLGAVPAEHLDAATLALLESDLFAPGLYSVCHLAAEAILDAWRQDPTAGFYEITRRLFGFSPNEIVLDDLTRARAEIHAVLPDLLARAKTARNRSARQHTPLPAYEQVIPSQLVTTLARGHKGREGAAFRRTWTGNTSTHHILCELRKTVNELVNRYGAKRSGNRTWDPLPSRITVELAREAKRGVTKRNDILKEQKDREKEQADADKVLNTFCADSDLSFGRMPRSLAIQRLQLYDQQGGHCPYCGEPICKTHIFDRAATELDHVIPRDLGGDSPDNLVLAHKACNAAKNNRTPYDYLGADLLDTPVLGTMWEKFRKAGRSDKTRVSAPRDDKAFMKYIGWRFLEDAAEVAAEKQERRSRRLLQDTARATRLARLYLAALVMPDDATRLGHPDADPEPQEALYRVVARVLAVQGSVTRMLRDRILQTPKDRTFTLHHAEDACLMLLAGPAVVQAFNTENARRDRPRDDDAPPVDVAPDIRDDHHLTRLRRAAGRAHVANLRDALSDLVAGSHYDPDQGRDVWHLTRQGKGVRRRILDLVERVSPDIRATTPPDTGTPGKLHNDTHYGRHELPIEGSEKKEVVFSQRVTAGDLVNKLQTKPKEFPDPLFREDAPGAVLLGAFRDEIERRHDRLVDPEGRHADRWISTRLAGLVPTVAAAVAAEVRELEALQAIPDAARTAEQTERRAELEKIPRLRQAAGKARPINRLRAREAEILRRVFKDPSWGPRGLRGLKMREKASIYPARIREKKTDALGRPAPGAAAWVKTDGNAVSQIWLITSVITANGERVKLSKPERVTVEISKLEFARLNTLDDMAGAGGGNRPPPLRQDINRLTSLAETSSGATEGGYTATAVSALRKKAATKLKGKKLWAQLADDWTLDAEGTRLEAEVARNDTVTMNGVKYRVAVLTDQLIYGIPVKHAGSAPRTEKDIAAFAKLYGVRPQAGKGVRIPAEKFTEDSG